MFCQSTQLERGLESSNSTQYFVSWLVAAQSTQQVAIWNPLIQLYRFHLFARPNIDLLSINSTKSTPTIIWLWCPKSKPKIRILTKRTVNQKIDLHHYQNHHHFRRHCQQQLELPRLAAHSLLFHHRHHYHQLASAALGQCHFCFITYHPHNIRWCHSPSPIGSLASSIPPPNIIEASWTIHHRRWWWCAPNSNYFALRLTLEE